MKLSTNFKLECSSFLENSGGFPLLKNLSKNGDDFRRVKVRKKKHSSLVINVFNEVFKDSHTDIINRSIFCHGPYSFEPEFTETLEPFFIFPINGFEFLFNSQIKSWSEYAEVFDSLNKTTNSPKELLANLLKISYSHGTMADAIDSGAELVVYGIPYYYAVRYSTVKDYSDFVKFNNY